MLYHDENLSLVYALSGRIIKVCAIGAAPKGSLDSAMKGDIVIDYGDYRYFSNAPESALASAWEKGKKESIKVVVYRPADKKLHAFAFNESVKNEILGLECPYAAETEEETLAYVAGIKAVYEKDSPTKN